MAEQNAERSEGNAEMPEPSLGRYRREDTTRGRLGGYSAGDIHGAFIREARRALERAGGDALQATNMGLSRLHGYGLITAREVERLSRILGVMFAQAHGEDSRREHEAFHEVRDTYQTMVLDVDASPTGLAIGSVAVDAFLAALMDGLRSDSQEGQRAAASTRRRLVTMAADGAGAVIGGAAGGAIGGAEGAEAGAAVGGIGASAIAEAIQEAVK